jgi:hypothetical protein
VRGQVYGQTLFTPENGWRDNPSKHRYERIKEASSPDNVKRGVKEGLCPSY